MWRLFEKLPGAFWFLFMSKNKPQSKTQTTSLTVLQKSHQKCLRKLSKTVPTPESAVNSQIAKRERTTLSTLLHFICCGTGLLNKNIPLVSNVPCIYCHDFNKEYNLHFSLILFIVFFYKRCIFSKHRHSFKPVEPCFSSISWKFVFLFVSDAFIPLSQFAVFKGLRGTKPQAQGSE